MNVRFALGAVTQNPQLTRILQQLAKEIEAHAVCLTRSDHIPEAEDPAGKIEHVAVSRYQGFARQFAGPIRRDGDQRTIIYAGLLLAQVAVNAAARSVKNRCGSRPAHRLDNLIS